MSEKKLDDSKRCPECKSANLELVGTRDRRAPGSGSDGPVVAKTINVRCRRCGASWDILRRVSN
jgi:hypothetical protein